MVDFISSCFGGGYGMGYGWIAGGLFIVVMVLLIIWLVQQISRGGKIRNKR
jgi:heme exporter protein D